MMDASDTAIPTAVIGAAGAILAAAVALLGSWGVLRSAKRMRNAESSVEQRKLDQSAFKAFTDRYDRERQDMEKRLVRAEAMTEKAEEQVAKTRTLLHEMWDYVLTLKAVMRDHNVPAPPTPPRLGVAAWEQWDDPRPNGSG